MCYLDMLHKLQKRLCRIDSPTLSTFFEGITVCFGTYSSELAEILTLMFLVGSFVGVVGCSFFCQHSCFFPRIARWWNYVLAECFAFL